MDDDYSREHILAFSFLRSKHWDYGACSPQQLAALAEDPECAKGIAAWRSRQVRTKAAAPAYLTRAEFDAFIREMITVLGTETKQHVREFVVGALEPLIARIAALESRPKGLVYLGTWSEDTTYTEGDCVTRRGSMWIAKAATTAKPGESGDWQLCVKAGRDGKDYVTR